MAVVVPSAHAAPWGYEQVSPAGGASIDAFGVGASADASTGVLATLSAPLEGQPGDGRTGPYQYVAPRGGTPWTVGPVDVGNGNQLVSYLLGLATDGEHILHGALLPTLTPNAYIVRRFNADGTHSDVNAPGLGVGALSATADLATVAFRGTNNEDPVYVSTAGGSPTLASVDNDGAPMITTALGGAMAGTSTRTLVHNALSADGSSVIFMSPAPLAGDDDGTAADVYRRILTPGSEETILISDANGSGDPDANTPAHYRWASSDHSQVLWRTAEQLVPGDTDNREDLYLRVGDGTPVLVTQGEQVNGSPTGNGAYDAEWAMASDDGNRFYFATQERLTPDAPADGASSLYERDIAEGVTRFVAGPLTVLDVNVAGTDTYTGAITANAVPDISFRGIRVTPSGVVFMAEAQLAGDTDNQEDIFSWSRSAGLTLVSAPEAGAPASPPADATLLGVNLSDVMEMPLITGGRSVSADGSRVFFTTAESMTAEDTDGGYRDVYAWTAGEGVSLVTPAGDEPYHGAYIESSADGTEVFFHTYESILPGDTDPNAADVYVAILGGGAPPSKPALPEPPAGPGAPAGPLPQVPAVPSPGSSTPAPPEAPAEDVLLPGPAEDDGDRGDRGGRAELAFKPARRLRKGDVAVLRVTPSVAGRLQVKAHARLPRKGKLRTVRVAAERQRVSGERQRVRVELHRAAVRRLEDKGRLRVRFTLRLKPSGEQRAVTDRITVTLRSGDRR